VIAYFAVLAVALCVAMMLIVISVMDGFLHKVELAAKGLFGDIVVESNTLAGLSRYDEFIQDITQGPNKIPDVEAASPYISTYGIISVPGNDYRQAVQVAGIRLPERTKVSNFSKGLFAQKDFENPTFDPSTKLMLQRIDEDTNRLEEMLKAARDPQSKLHQYLGAIKSSLIHHRNARWRIEHLEKNAENIKALETRLEAARDAGEGDTIIKSLEDELADLRHNQILPPDQRVILGIGIPSLSIRPEGQTIRMMVPSQQIAITLFPLGRRSITNIQPIIKPLTVVDDSRTDVYSIDSTTIYVPFETLQKLTDMDAGRDDKGEIVSPARCSAIHIKVRDGITDEARLAAICKQVQDRWDNFIYTHPDAASSSMSIKTWRQRQADFISNIANQRTLVVIMFAVISLVAVVLVFVLFYTIVMQKTKDIGVVKALGGSSPGVAGIFLTYGAAIGFVGSIVGVIGGYFFVKNINAIHTWVGNTFGTEFFRKEYFMFETIPNEVQPTAIVLIVAAAILAGVVGSLLPAYLASRMQPVEALRYE